MATNFKNKVLKDVGITPVDVVTTTTYRTTVIGISIANVTESLLYIDITLTDESDVTGYYIKGIILPPRATLRAVNGGEKLILAPNNTLSVSSSVESSIDVIVSYVEIT